MAARTQSLQGATSTGPAPRYSTQAVTVSPGARVRVDGDEHTVVESLTIETGGATLEQLSATRLVIRSDGAQAPCVDVPIPALLGQYWQPLPYQSSPGFMTVLADKYAFMLPIPVGKGLEVGLEPYGAGPSLQSCRIGFNTRQLAAAPPYRFCAEYRSQVSKRGVPLTFADIKGEGNFVGLTFGSDGLEHKKLSFLEGNELIYVDGAQKPSLEGTGTEDFFNSAWYFSCDPPLGVLHGRTSLSEGPPPRVSAFRLMVPDRVRFTKSLRFDMQHGSSNSVPDTLYRTVAIWYQRPPCEVGTPSEPQLPAKLIAAESDDPQRPSWLPGAAIGAVCLVGLAFVLLRGSRKR